MSADPARLIDLAFDAIFAFGIETGLITFWNRGAERLYGWTSTEAIGKHPQELLQTQHPTTREDILQVLQRRGHWEGALIQRARDGRSVVVDARWVLDREGQLVLEVNRDVTLAWESTEMLRGLERSRSEFIEQVAHQLRSPVTLLRGYVELLQEGRIEGPVDAEFAKALQMLYDSAEEMHRVTERLVSASRVDLQPGNVRLSQCDLATIAQLAIRELNAADVDGEIPYEGESQLPVVGDPNQLEMVVRQLVLAGLRISRRKPVTVRGTSHADQVSLVIDISSASSSDGQPGSQVVAGTPESLEHVRRVAQLHHGEIEINSGADGQSLELKLPCAEQFGAHSLAGGA